MRIKDVEMAEDINISEFKKKVTKLEAEILVKMFERMDELLTDISKNGIRENYLGFGTPTWHPEGYSKELVDALNPVLFEMVAAERGFNAMVIKHDNEYNDNWSVLISIRPIRKPDSKICKDKNPI